MKGAAGFMRHVQFQQDMTDLRLLCTALQRAEEEYIPYATDEDEEAHNERVVQLQNRLSESAAAQARKVRDTQRHALEVLGLTASPNPLP